MFHKRIHHLNFNVLAYLFIFLAVLGIGCTKEEKLDLNKIENVLFKNIAIIYYAKDWKANAEALTNNEIMELKSSIKNGADFSEDKINMPPFKDTNNVVFILQYKNKLTVNLVYDRESKYLCFPKSAIHQGEKSKHGADIQWIERNLSGIYRVHPSSDFEIFLKQN